VTPAVVLSLFAAVAFALGTVLQQRGALRTPAGADDARFLVQVLREPVWVAGGVLQAAGWVLQGLALDRGALVVVQSLTTLSLVVALPLGVWLTGQRVGAREILGASAVVGGIVVFLWSGSPGGGTSTPSASAWWTAVLVSGALIVLGAGVARRQRAAARAALFGATAGIAFALQAAMTKQFVGELGHGVAHLLATWSTYGLIVSALVGFVLQQSALKTGALAPAMAASNASTLLFSVVFGLAVFGETLESSSGRVVPAWAGLVVAVSGVVALAGGTTAVREVPPPSAAVPR
jgi:drug/metabolite transporter (DMT)-like permease